MPPGLTANLTGVQECSEAQIGLAKSPTRTGAQEESEPACPPGSEIGHTIAEAGVGTVLAQAPGRIYLGGPYEGAPFSIVSVTAAKVGPFDLGTVVVHLPLFINPETAAVTAGSGTSNQIPHIIKGIVIHVRNIRVYVDRTHFILNPGQGEEVISSSSAVGLNVRPVGRGRRAFARQVLGVRARVYGVWRRQGPPAMDSIATGCGRGFGLRTPARGGTLDSWPRPRSASPPLLSPCPGPKPAPRRTALGRSARRLAG